MKKTMTIIGSLALFGLLVYAGLVGWVYYREVSVPEPTDYDSIIVLGAQVLPSGEPSVQLRERLNTAITYFQKGSPVPIVTCGAQGTNEPRPEGDVMRDVLIADGIPSEYVYSDSTSMNTRENISNALHILKELNTSKPLIITSDYHLPRAMQMIEDHGIHPQGAGALCRPEPEFWLKNHMREALAWVKYWGIRIGLPL